MSDSSSHRGAYPALETPEKKRSSSKDLKFDLSSMSADRDSASVSKDGSVHNLDETRADSRHGSPERNSSFRRKGSRNRPSTSVSFETTPLRNEESRSSNKGYGVSSATKRSSRPSGAEVDRLISYQSLQSVQGQSYGHSGYARTSHTCVTDPDMQSLIPLEDKDHQPSLWTIYFMQLIKASAILIVVPTAGEYSKKVGISENLCPTLVPW